LPLVLLVLLVMLGNDGLIAAKAFQQALDTALAGAGFGRGPDPRHAPHLTLRYDDHHVTAHPIEPVVWAAHEFVLVRSLIGRSRHEALAHLRLRG
jgi:2'-5' RNA ligase